MNLTLSLLQQILSLPQEDALVPLDRYFDSENERELQLLGFLPPDERREEPQLVALTYDRRAYEEDWELERQRIRHPKPKTYRQMLTQNRQPSYHRPSLLEGMGKICLGGREIRIPASSAGDIGDAGVLLIARFFKAGVKAEQLGGDFQHQYLHRLSLDIPWQELLPLAKAASQNPNEPVRLIPRKESEKVPARKRMTLSVGMKERAYTCTVEGREHHFWIEQVQLYDLWSDQEERIRDWKESGKCSEEELRQLKWSWERTAAKLCPKGKRLPLIVYESEEDIQLDFYDRPYLNSLVPTRNRDTELGMSGDKEEKGPHGIRPRYAPLQTPVDPDAQKVEVELLNAWLPRENPEIVL